MNQTDPSHQNALSGKILRYGCAAGAGVLVSPLTMADGFEFTPPGGLPIVIDTTTTSVDPLEVDLDGDGFDDYEIFYETGYGGGFVIRPLDLTPGVGAPAVQVVRDEDPVQFTGVWRALRSDPTEYIAVDDSAIDGNGNSYGDYRSFERVFIDSDGDGGELSAYTPFRDNPGFLGLSLGTPSFNGGYASTLQVELNSDGSQLTILGGFYRQDGLDLYLGEDDLITKDGFESASSAATPPSTALQALAYGKGD